MIHKVVLIFLAYLCVPTVLPAQTGNSSPDRFNASRGSFGSGGNSFNSNRSNGFNDQRLKLNVEYVKITRQPWKTLNSSHGIMPPHENVKPVAPIKIYENDILKENNDRKIEIESVTTPIIQKGQAKPVAPIEQVDENVTSFIDLSFFNTPIRIRRPSVGFPKLNSSGNNDVADMLGVLSGQEFSNMLFDCVGIKKSYNLDDWPFFLMVKAFADNVYGINTNESSILTVFVLSQAGFKVRLARADNNLCVLYASEHTIYRQSYFNIGGDRFYFLGTPHQNAEICPAYFSSEKPLSLWLTSVPRLASSTGKSRFLTSERYPDFNFSISADANLVNLMDTYPSSEVEDNFMTRWAMYASTPICDKTKSNLYGKIRSLITGISKYEAAERILNWVQTAFTYEYDDKVWGMDRAFFPEETLYYPYADCEDRSILFTRIVRDLLGLECILVYYPGHLASAVCFDSDVSGDYIEYRGKRYVVCDPTYIGAKIGMTMPGMDNITAKIVVLRR